MKCASSTQSGVFRTFLKPCKGQSLVEFALVAPLFFLLVFAVIDLGHVFFTQMTLQHALREAGRYAVTGNHVTQGGTNLSRVASIKQIAQKAAAGVDVSNVNISSASGGTGSAGGPQDTVTVSLTTSMKLFTPIIGRYFGTNGVYTFTVGTTFRNEPFPPANTN